MLVKLILAEGSKGLWVDKDDLRSCIRDHAGKSTKEVSFNMYSGKLRIDNKYYTFPMELI